MNNNIQLFSILLYLLIPFFGSTYLVTEVLACQQGVNAVSIFHEVKNSIVNTPNNSGVCHPSKYSSTHEVITSDVAAMDHTNIIDWDMSKSGNEISMTLSSRQSKYSLSVELSHGRCVRYEIYHLVD